MTPAAYAQAHRRRFVAELQEFARFPSVSAQKTHADDVRRCARWLADHLRAVGLDDVCEIATRGNPVVYARWHRHQRAPHVLIYGHYDVQPAEPLDAWTSPPFEPAVRGNCLYGRGVADDKGQLFTHVKAMESYLRTEGEIPVNVTCLFEGEEEIGSPHLPEVMQTYGEALAADVAVVSDMRILGPDRPAITESLRGALSVEIEVQGPREELHSGNYGGAVLNPLQALSQMLAQLHDGDGRIAIPGFYDHVCELSFADRAYMAAVGPTDAEILHSARSATGWGEAGYSAYERTTIRPALAINGISGGYQGQGAKAVIPARASAKLNFRLVAHQDPAKIESLFRRFIAAIAPAAVTVSIRTLLRAHPVAVDKRHPAMRATAAAYRAGFGHAPVFIRTGGTVPIVHLLQTLLGVTTVMMGFALPDSALHAANERLHLPTFLRGIRTSQHFLAQLADAGS